MIPTEIKEKAPVTQAAVKAAFGQTWDFEERTVTVGGKRLCMCCIDGLTSGTTISETVLRPLTSKERFPDAMSEREMIKAMSSGTAYGCTVRVRETVSDTVSDLLNGFCAVIFPGERTAVTFEAKSGDKRAVGLPTEEKAVKGAKDSFTETLKTNTALVRKKLKNADLRFVEFEAGEKTHTKVVAAYIEGYTDKKLVSETSRRISEINIEGVLTSAALEESLEDDPRSPFPQILNTERPDRFCMNLIEGRVGILADGIPEGYLVPGTFTQFFKVPEDAAVHWLVASVLTLLRYVSMLVTLLLPAFYVAVASFHQEMLPTKLIVSIVRAKENVPFSTGTEVVGMLVIFELLQEAGLRLPDPAGDTVGIIGALIVGQSAVEAKIISPFVIIVVALSGIAGYTIPDQDMSSAFRVCRFLLVTAAMIGGMFGITLVCVLLVSRLCMIDSFGVPYLSPFVGRSEGHAWRALLRFPVSIKKEREPELGAGEGK